ncbi:hypothetical protein [Apibacter sp. HY039]|uniref:hypothetical protein n=1 Tax=Apibacter sp. HY039 TaxID=2501476 RepID=UPI000FEB7F33|nr:hypothetical protein [Apibacter sp. HY039]
MNLKLDHTKNILIDSTKNLLKKEGFVYDQVKEAFIREDSLGNKQIISFFFYNHDTNIQIEIKVELKIKKIEDIYYDSIKCTNIKYEDLKTLSVNIGAIIAYQENNLMVGGPNRNKVVYLIENNNDTELLSKVIPKRIEEYILPFFKDNTSIQKVDYLLNSHVKEISPFRFLYPYRSCIGVIAAKLNNSPYLSEIIVSYKERLKNSKGEFQKQFEDVVNQINNI